MTALDALARAEAGTLVDITHDDQGRIVEHRKHSIAMTARAIREARQGLDMLHKLSVASGASNPIPAGIDHELDERIAVALEKVASRHTLTSSGSSSPALPHIARQSQAR